MKARGRLVVGSALAVLFLVPASATAEGLTAEVRTWGGQSWRLAQPSLEQFYTVVAKPEEASAPASPAGERRTPVGGTEVPLMFGTKEALSSELEKKGEIKQGQRQLETVTFHVASGEIKVPLANIRSLAFSRQPVSRSPFPPHIAPAHFRHAATLVLTDGSVVEADYVNLGATFLRGMSPEGRVEIPWGEISTIRFTR